MRLLRFCALLAPMAFIGALAPGLAAAQDTTRATPPAPTPPAGGATLAGVIHDVRGAPVADAEIVIRETGRSVRTDAKGAFTLAEVTPGAYQIWFRHIGFISTQYNWAARWNERTTVAVSLTPLAATLDPVVVQARENRRMRGTAGIVGVVVDSAGNPVDEAEVQLVGADRTGLTHDNGGFAFSSLPLGTYVIRARKLGFSPNVLTVQLQDSENVQVAIRIRALPAMLDAVAVNEKSGYGKAERAWDELEARKRWPDPRDVTMGPEDLQRYGGMSLDLVAKHGGGAAAEGFAQMRQGHVTSISGRGISRGGTMGTSVGDATRGADRANEYACILENGTTERQQPLRNYYAKDIQLLEIYPSNTEVTNTVASHMTGKCRATDALTHPTYYVIWFKDAT